MPSSKPNVAALVEQMPATDKELQAQQRAASPPPNPPSDAATKPSSPSESGDAASKFTGPDPIAAEKIFAEILLGGNASLVELLGLIREPGDADFKHYKAGYVLHGLVLYAGRPGGQEKERKLLVDVCADALRSDKYSQALKGTLIRELQWIGDKSVIGALSSQLLDDELCDGASRALLAIRDGAPAEFRKALPQAKGRNRIAIIQALGVLSDVEAAGALRKALSEDDRDVRRMAGWALANIGDAEAVEDLLKLADQAEGWEGTQAVKACFLLAERLQQSDRNAAATRIFAHLRESRKDPNQRHIREAAENALRTAPF